MERVEAHLRQGLDHRAANHLAGYLSLCPTDLAARERLAQIHESMRNWTEAGRWGYFADAPHPKAVKAFEKAYSEPTERWQVLRWPDTDPDHMPPVVRRRLEALLAPPVQPAVSQAAAAPAGPPHPRPRPAVRAKAAHSTAPPRPDTAVGPRLAWHDHIWGHPALGFLLVLAAGALCVNALLTVMEWLGA